MNLPVWFASADFLWSVGVVVMTPRITNNKRDLGCLPNDMPLE